ncbi:3',5'-cyclic-nucleotide phosphodiesterase [Thiohalorhabdus sp.]|uniref:3',5'-cyclic-nucleotide phosphodiesterase n=1 Tax=Thiohalorhabdus sp. TaxID=3094134 RepID=UPI002FC36832
MQLRVLGCSGGVRQGARTTAFLLDDDVLVDAGSGVGDLTLGEMAAIRHVFLTHCHLDHVAFLPLLLDTLFEALSDPARHPLTVHAQTVTLDALRSHIFNGVLWPDFTRLPHPEGPVVQLAPLEPGESYPLGGARTVTMVPGHHAVPTVGYHMEAPDTALAFSGDCTTNDDLWQGLNGCRRLDHLIVEAAFPDEQAELAAAAKHYTPASLAADLSKLAHEPLVWITHTMPGKEARIVEQCRAAMPDREVRSLASGEVLPLR